MNVYQLTSSAKEKAANKEIPVAQSETRNEPSDAAATLVSGDVHDIDQTVSGMAGDIDSYKDVEGGVVAVPAAADAASSPAGQEPPDEEHYGAPQEEAYDVPQDSEARIVPESEDQQTTFEGVLAQDPQQTRDQMLEDAVEAKDVRVYDASGRKSRWRILLSIAVVVLIVLAAVGVTLGVIIPRRNEASFTGTGAPTVSPTDPPSTAPSQAPTSTSFAIVAQAVEAAFGTVLNDTTTPQYRAAEWMAEEDQFPLINSPLDDPSRFAQRYAMSVFYYATGGDESWIRQANFLSPTLDLCSWQEDAPEGADTILGILGVECFSSGEVMAIEFCK